MSSTLSIVTAPTFDSETLPDIKNHLRVDIEDDDSLISSLITGALSCAGTMTRRTIYTTTYDLSLDYFPCSGGFDLAFRHRAWNHPHFAGMAGRHRHKIEIPRPPFASVTSIKYLDQGGNLQTLDSGVYRVVPNTEGQAYVVPAFGQIFPMTSYQDASVTIRFVAGYGDWSTLPDGIKNAVRLLVGHWYNHREAVSDGSFSEVPMAVAALLAPFEWGSYA